MKYKFIRLFALSSLLLVGCKNKEEEHSEEPKGEESPDLVIDATICEIMETFEDKSVYDIKLKYNDNYFKNDASTYNKDLMLLSFGAANSTVENDKGLKFYSDIGFTSVYTSPEYDTGGKEDSARYIVSKKVIDDFTVYSVSFKSNQYGIEWVNNLTLGESGNHNGFLSTATKVYNNLLTILSGEHNVKLWFTGYSRGGALANILSHLVLSNETLGINESNLYTYTFAGTRGLTKEDAKPYKNVFNLFNSADLLSNIVPEEYGLYRCGRQIDIFDEHLDDYLASFSSEMTLPEFTVSKGVYANDKEFTKYFIKQLLKVDTEAFDPEKYPYDICTREHFYQVQESVAYVVGHVLSIPSYLPILSEKFAGITTSEILSYITDGGEKLHDTLKEIFDENNVDYEDPKLLSSCQVLSLLLKRYSSLITKLISNSNATRMISMHYTETIYILIQKVNSVE